ncbi:MAG: DUF2635 domain-containing protein [Magnetospirillum sp.]|nr:MAG: DUF2635 domain-containing protein [Magnetospirillum sp.]
MSEKMYLRPAPGRVIPDPATGRDLPDHGDAVTPSRLWRLHLRDGDVLTTTAEEIAMAAAARTPEPPVETTTKKKGA